MKLPVYSTHLNLSAENGALKCGFFQFTPSFFLRSSDEERSNTLNNVVPYLVHYGILLLLRSYGIVAEFSLLLPLVRTAGTKREEKKGEWSFPLWLSRRVNWKPTKFRTNEILKAGGHREIVNYQKKGLWNQTKSWPGQRVQRAHNQRTSFKVRRNQVENFILLPLQQDG